VVEKREIERKLKEMGERDGQKYVKIIYKKHTSNSAQSLTRKPRRLSQPPTLPPLPVSVVGCSTLKNTNLSEHTWK
jgi:hypothetical protein